METIKNYLENMFMNLPNAPEVQKAKYELLQMMEDKYTELKEEGKTENEAIGIVISEFGNLEELAGDLGIEGIMKQGYFVSGKQLSLEEVKTYLSVKAKDAYYTAMGVLLCIISLCGPIFFSGGIGGELSDAVGVTLMFVAIAVGVGMFIYSGVLVEDWKRLDKEVYFMDFATTEFVRQAKENYKTNYALLMTVGVGCCILSVIPAILLDGIIQEGDVFVNLSGGALFILVGIGVFMIVLASTKQGSYDKLLEISKGERGSENFKKQQEDYSNPKVKAVMSVYWPTITCIYLIWSFLTSDWHITWIIWPVAGVVQNLIKALAQSSK